MSNLENDERKRSLELRDQALELSDLTEVTPEQRQLLVQHIKMELEAAKKLPRDQLHRDPGIIIAHGLNGAIALQDWIKDANDYIKTNEPGIEEILGLIMPLELEPEEHGLSREEVEERWQKAFEAAERLE